MKKPQPNELGLTVLVHPDCPGNHTRFERVVVSTFNDRWINRARIQPNEVYLRVVVWCRDAETLNHYSIRAEFVRFDETIAPPVSLGEGYRLTGLGSYGRILRGTAEVTRMAIEDHITANFDL